MMPWQYVEDILVAENSHQTRHSSVSGHPGVSYGKTPYGSQDTSSLLVEIPVDEHRLRYVHFALLQCNSEDSKK